MKSCQNVSNFLERENDIFKLRMKKKNNKQTNKRIDTIAFAVCKENWTKAKHGYSLQPIEIIINYNMFG